MVGSRSTVSPSINVVDVDGGRPGADEVELKSATLNTLSHETLRVQGQCNVLGDEVHCEEQPIAPSESNPPTNDKNDFQSDGKFSAP